MACASPPVLSRTQLRQFSQTKVSISFYQLTIASGSDFHT